MHSPAIQYCNTFCIRARIIVDARSPGGPGDWNTIRAISQQVGRALWVPAPRGIMFPMVEQVAFGWRAQEEDTFAIVGSEFPCYCTRWDKAGVILTPFDIHVHHLSRHCDKKNADKFSYIDCNLFHDTTCANRKKFEQSNYLWKARITVTDWIQTFHVINCHFMSTDQRYRVWRAHREICPERNSIDSILTII